MWREGGWKDNWTRAWLGRGREEKEQNERTATCAVARESEDRAERSPALFLGQGKAIRGGMAFLTTAAANDIVAKRKSMVIVAMTGLTPQELALC